jgi:mycofactocin precursor
LTRKSSGREERYSEVTEDTIDRQEENVVEVDELLVEEVSIDGMCGVYRSRRNPGRAAVASRA